MRFLFILYIVDKSCTLIYLYNFIVNRTKYVAQNTPPPLKSDHSNSVACSEFKRIHNTYVIIVERQMKLLFDIIHILGKCFCIIIYYILYYTILYGMIKKWCFFVDFAAFNFCINIATIMWYLLFIIIYYILKMRRKRQFCSIIDKSYAILM